MSRSDGVLPVPFNLPPYELLHYLPAHKVLICKLCQYAIQPAAIPRHLKDLHHIYRSHRRPFIEYASQYTLSEPSEVVLPQAHEFPVPFLPVEDGVSCDAEGCGHLCVTVKRMKSHWTTVHHSATPESRSWRNVKLQTFFRGNQLQYFEVSEVLTPPPDHEMIPKQSERDMNYRDVQNEYDSPMPSPPSDNTLAQQAQQPRGPRIHLGPNEMELLNHFTTSTYESVASNPGTERIWKTIAPQLGMEHPFLMHGILACAALHLAHLYPDHRYEYNLRAANHQDQALSEFRKVVSVPVTEENGNAVYAFTHLLVIHVFASDGYEDSLLLTGDSEGDSLPQWLHFIRNGCTMLGPVWMSVATGPMRSLISKAQATLECVTDMMAWEAIEYDPRPLLTFIPPFESEFAWSEKVCMTYFKAAIELGKAFSCVEDIGSAISTWDAMHMWPMRLTEDFMILLHEWHPSALILLAHYCVLLQGLKGQWYFKDRAAKMLRVIHERLDDRLRWTLHWPIQQLGISV
ncbi:hypothetical protein BP6252_05413 [Coleophoma cylindrospora]|uniref:C2H2-type domain-containing protein n=1 Tax=Coleophoma cylindrospora TaxID=1849047 RepID=A0A3D8RTS3_9HELO|nr:hypothetical protein BP6252_05413 [Coleophoma cylindrospora]